jgi:hypothetical protein
MHNSVYQDGSIRKNQRETQKSSFIFPFHGRRLVCDLQILKPVRNVLEEAYTLFCRRLFQLHPSLSPVSSLVYYLYTVKKKVSDFPVPSRDIIPGQGEFGSKESLISEILKSRLGTGKSLTFSYSVVL